MSQTNPAVTRMVNDGSIHIMQYFVAVKLTSQGVLLGRIGGTNEQCMNSITSDIDDDVCVSGLTFAITAQSPEGAGDMRRGS